MEPFTVTCSTCESRIRVRNPNMLGQLANCPKCGSMLMLSPVEVASPPLRSGGGHARIEVEGAGGAVVDSTAVTKEGLVSTLHERSPAPPPELPGKDFGGSQVGSPSPTEEDDYRLEELPEDELAGAPPVLSPGVLAAAWQADSTPHVPSEHWTSDSSNRTRQYLLVGFLGVSGIVFAAILFWGFLRWYAEVRSAPTKAALPTQPTAVDDLGPTGADLPPADTSNKADDSSTDPASVTPIVSSTDVTQPPLAEMNPGSPDTIPALPDGPSDTSQVIPGTAPLAGQTEPPPTDPSGAGNPAELPADAVEPSAAPPSLPKQLAAFAPMLQYEIQPQFPDAIEIRTEAPVTAEDLGLTSTVGLPEIPAVDVTAQSQAKISALVIAPLPMSQFVSLWSNVSGIPTVVDIESLAAAGIDRNQELSLGLAQSASVGSLIPQLGNALGLATHARDNRYLELVAPSELTEQKLPTAIPLAGLVSDSGGEEWLIGALKELFPEHEIVWRIEEGQLTRPQTANGDLLAADQWFRAIRLIEGWRIAVSGESSLDQYTQGQLSSALIQPTDVVGLDTVLQEVTPQARPVAQVLPRMCQAAGVHAWIDWANVGAVGLGPQTTAVFITSARPLQRVLADYASEFSLTFAVLDKQSLWITSNQAYRSDPQLYVLPADGKTAAEWKSQLRPLTPAAAGGLGVGSVVVIATPDERFMLVRCCRPTLSF